MKHTLPYPDEFNIKEVEVAGEECYLVTPLNMGVKWFDYNAMYRSCIVTRDLRDVISQGFKKFVNFGECPEFEPWDDNWPITARRKLDGSLLIVSRWNGHIITRTRGTVDARILPNGHEIDLLLEKYPKISEEANENFTFLFEWTTPSNIIVLRESAEPKLTLVGAIQTQTGTYMSQDDVDKLAKKLGVDRPETYEYNSIAECIADVKMWEGKEGVVIFSPDGQTMKKIKADSYILSHRVKSRLVTKGAMVDYYFEHGCSLEDIDWEVLVSIKNELVAIDLEYHNLKNELKTIKDRYFEKFKTQKEYALFCIDHFPTYTAFLFAKNKQVEQNALRKMMKS